MPRRSARPLVALLLVGATACGSAGDTVDSVDVPPTAAGEAANDADVSAPVTEADVVPTDAVEATTPSSTTSAPAAPDAPSETVATGTAITQLSPQAVPSITSNPTSRTEPRRDAVSLDTNSAPVQAAVADLAARLDVPTGEVSIVEASAVMWGDSSLGCPQPGMQYLQVVADGSLVVLDVGGIEYRYTGGSPLALCEQRDV